jgi:glycosyltransferase involved in cell wall biosynthesis
MSRFNQVFSGLFMPTAVLMSTYNGLRFIDEQIRSILDQFGPADRLIIRDDGSSDGTVDYLKALSDPRIVVSYGPNIGASPSFLALTAAVPAEADMIMFADQDDVWLPGKIERARAQLGDRIGSDRPALYCSRLTLVDVTLNEMGLSRGLQIPPSFENALVENIVTGCTSAFNRAALKRIAQYGDPKLIFFHDWWCYLVVSAFGDVIFDDQPMILYRQHGNNVVGMDAGLKRYLTVLKFLMKNNWVQIVYNQNRNFYETHGENLPENRRAEMAALFSRQSIPAALRLMATLKRRRQSVYWEFLFRGWLVMDMMVRFRFWITRPEARLTARA